MTEDRATNIMWHSSHVDRQTRQELLHQRGCTIWFTGLPSSGKSTTAFTVEHELVRLGYLAYVLDGDNVRHGLNRNLGFSPADREENIRRIGEVAKLFADAGVVTMTSFISPYLQDRLLARQLHDAADLPFVEVFVDTPVDVCEQRDPKGLYAKARRGEIRGFTGVDDPYEPPTSPELTVHTAQHLPSEIATLLLAYLRQRGLIQPQGKR